MHYTSDFRFSQPNFVDDLINVIDVIQTFMIRYCYLSILYFSYEDLQIQNKTKRLNWLIGIKSPWSSWYNLLASFYLTPINWLIWFGSKYYLNKIERPLFGTTTAACWVLILIIGESCFQVLVDTSNVQHSPKYLRWNYYYFGFSYMNNFEIEILRFWNFNSEI